tara:strand:+ start:19 stop:939 length:921 start_codon:yes stop_codon:yes gene_type:complete
MKRRNFAKLTALSSLIGFAPTQSFSKSLNNESDIKISLAQWSLNKSIKSGELPILDFAKKARSFDINAIEYVASLYTEHSDVLKRMSMNNLAKELLKRSDDFGIDNFLFMIDGQGDLASSRKRKRLGAIEQHKKWIDFSFEIGCETMRVNLRGEDNLERWTGNSIESLTELSDYNKDINVVVENHGGLSSNGKFLANVIKQVKLDNCGTLPDFGNFCLDGWPKSCNGKFYDKYLGVEELMPFAHAVSAKSYDFDEKGNETSIDFERMINIVKSSGFQGYIGIEYEGEEMSEEEGILATKKLLEKLI